MTTQYIRYPSFSGSSDVNAIGAIDGQTPSANGAVISGNALYLQSASATVPGLVNITTQSFAGAKTFLADLTASRATSTTTLIQSVNTSTGDAVLAASVTGVGDPHIQFLGAGLGTTWHAGVDNSASDVFTIGIGTAPGTTDYLTISIAGAYTITSKSVAVSAANSGASNTISVTNTTNAASSHAVMQMSSTGASGGNAFNIYATNTATWSAGVQNNASGKFSISQNSSPGTNDYLTIAVAGGVAIHGTTTNDNATAAYVGEYIESVTNAAAGSSNVWTNLTSISLTAGDWDVTGMISTDGNGATFSGNSRIAVSVNSGATTTDQVAGSNELGVPTVNTATQYRGGSISSYRLSLSGTTTVYLKTIYNYSVATPQVYGRLSARRVR